MLTIMEIVKEYLEKNRYGGLLNNEAECCCDISDLNPCDEPCIYDCKPAYKISCIGDDCEKCEVFNCEADKDKESERFYYSYKKEKSNG